MDIKDVKRFNLALLCERHGGRTAAASRLGYADTNHLNQMISGHAAIGGRVTKKIYAAFDLPPMWLESQRLTEWSTMTDKVFSRSEHASRSSAMPSQNALFIDVQPLDDSGTVLQLPEEFVIPGLKYFVMPDDSQSPGVKTGDIIVINPSQKPAQNALVAIWIGGQVTARRYVIMSDGDLLLACANHAFHQEQLTPDSAKNVSVAGVFYLLIAQTR